MDETRRKILIKNQRELVRKLDNLEELCDYLLKHDVFSEEMMDDILGKRKQTAKARKFLYVLRRRGPNAFDTFIEGLECCHMEHIASDLKQKLDRRPVPGPRTRSSRQPSTSDHFGEDLQSVSLNTPVQATESSGGEIFMDTEDAGVGDYRESIPTIDNERTTIQEVINGGELNTLRGVVCSTTGVLIFLKDGKREQMMKFSVLDDSGYVTVLVFNKLLFDLVTEAAHGKKYVKLEEYRRATCRLDMLIVDSYTTCSLLSQKTNQFTKEQIEEAGLSIYAKIIPISQAKRCKEKTFVSVKGKIKKVYASTKKFRKVILQDATDMSKVMVKFWEPRHEIQMEGGQTYTLYNVKVSHYKGAISFDTCDGTLIEVSQSESRPEIKRGSLVGSGMRGDQEVIEILFKGEQDEISFVPRREAMKKLKANNLKGNYLFTVVDGHTITNAELVLDQD